MARAPPEAPRSTIYRRSPAGGVPENRTVPEATTNSLRTPTAPEPASRRLSTSPPAPEVPPHRPGDRHQHLAAHQVERARTGDPAALNLVVRRLGERLTRMARHYARRSGEDPDDLLQEAWVGLLTALPTVDCRIGSPEQYLIRSARWKVLDQIKRARIRRCAALEEVACGTIPSPEAGVLAVASLGELSRHLTAMQQRVLHYLLAGYTWSETGRALGCTSANVAYHVRRIKRRTGAVPATDERWARRACK